jgi:hypothetical protein
VVLFRIAVLLGKTIGELCATMNAREFMYWVAYLGTYPPEQDNDWRAAIVCDSIYKAAGSKKSSPEKFMPERKRKRKSQTQTMEEQIAIMRGFGNGNSRNSNDPTRR